MITIEVWYNDDIKLWTIQAKDNEGNQLGEAEYNHLKKRAVEDAKYMRGSLHPEAAIKVFTREDELQKTL